MIEKIKKFLELTKQAVTIKDSQASWETKYSLIFPHIKRMIDEIDFNVEWNDPDMDYEDDVRAYVRAIEERAHELDLVLIALEEIT